MSWLRTVVRVGLYVGLVVVLAVAGYLLYLDRTITTVFEGRRWSIPAKVFAKPFELYPGAALGTDDLVAELERLGYRPRAGASEVGTFVRSERRIDVFLRPFTFLDGHREATRIAVRFSRANVIENIESIEHALAYVRLEPPVIGSFFWSHGEDRLVVTPDTQPKLLTDALKAVEDRKFDSHPGFDLAGIARAFLVNLREGEVRQGGSTLTQQLVKSYFLDNRRTVERKLREVAMAVILDARFEKDDILNAYVNEVYIGQDGSRAIHGFGLGSQFYFNKPLTELERHEIATLIAIIRGPSYYNPYRHPDRTLARRDLVLSTMLSFDLIVQEDYERAVAEPLILADAGHSRGAYYPAFMDLVRAQLARDYDADALSSQGYRIFTTLDPRVQDVAQNAVAMTLAKIERSRGFADGDLEAAVVVRGSQTGDVEAVVGGRRTGSQGFNRALNAHRQVGSLIKPVVYLTALESGRYHLASRIDDSPIVLHDYGDWAPRNFDGRFRGPVPMFRALGDSLNVATVRVGMDVGMREIVARIGDLANVEIGEPYPAMMLGAIDLTPIEVADLYAIFAGGGFVTPSHTVTAVLDDRGRTLSRYPLDVRQSVSVAHAGAITSALQIVMQRGTGRASKWSQRGVAGKTGTSDDFRDSWFAGYDGDALTVVWVGRDDNKPHGLTGSAGALRVWDAMIERLSLSRAIDPMLGRDYLWQQVDYNSGQRANSTCGDPVSVPLPKSAALPRKPGCGISLRDFSRTVRRWFDRDDSSR